MGKTKKKIIDEFVMFDVVYQDGTKSSRRKVAAIELAEDGDDARARTIIMDQDRKIAQMSGNDRGAIATLTRSPG